MRVIVTGAAGHIGRKLLPHFRGLGWDVLGIDVYGDDATSGMRSADLAAWDKEWVDLFEGADCVVHLAGAARPDAPWDLVSRLNIDLTLNVVEAAAVKGVARVVFASSNWVLAGHRFEDGVLAAETSPAPVNAYGASKLFGERVGKSLSERRGLSFISVRIGYSQHAAGNVPGPHMAWGSWGQAMWLADEDLLGLFTAAVAAPPTVRFAIVNAVSSNKGMRWSLREGEEALNFNPVESSVPSVTPEVATADAKARVGRGQIAKIEAELMRERW